ncbi:hypothetical protein HS1genome_1818 [Sulfodiicoccus acidiphilus]|uniref:Uncharacterized protein n=1 Tax=Sulfodiicoccus acidiphilus TaxID=1670455 RepID=A0A348B5H7_9CREN|nr:hypothetical protein [Sulfodiicoccus acidiphilus]BBD73429.1 hypothetical protein HS1genome_1818 [Sulfodiicoccus acidiphilus]GGT98598.1 hypothetical protein GCM10007116_15010 [Sulfodiicoccus acidiphilus]
MLVAFGFLVAGSAVLLLEFLGLVGAERDAVFLTWFMGFVVTMVVGITHLVFPPLVRAVRMKEEYIVAELVLMVSGTTLAIVGFVLRDFLGPVGVGLFVSSILMHLNELVRLTLRGN